MTIEKYLHISETCRRKKKFKTPTHTKDLRYIPLCLCLFPPGYLPTYTCIPRVINKSTNQRPHPKEKENKSKDQAR